MSEYTHSQKVINDGTMLFDDYSFGSEPAPVLRREPEAPEEPTLGAFTDLRQRAVLFSDIMASYNHEAKLKGARIVRGYGADNKFDTFYNEKNQNGAVKAAGMEEKDEFLYERAKAAIAHLIGAEALYKAGFSDEAVYITNDYIRRQLSDFQPGATTWEARRAELKRVQATADRATSYKKNAA